MMKRVCALLTALVLVLSAAAALADEAADTLLVTVNGQEIRESDEGLKFWINYLYSQITEGTEVDQATVNQYAMDYDIRYTLLDQELNRQGMSMTEEETAQYTESAKMNWESAVSSVMQSEYGITDESSEEDRSAARADAIDYIKVNYGYTEESYIAEELEYYHLSTLSTKFTEIMSADIVVSDEDVQAAFDEEVEQHKAAINDDAGAYEFYTNYYGYNLLYKPEGYRGISHILLEVDEELLNTWADLAEKLAAQETASEEETAADEATANEGETAEPTEEPVTQEMVDLAKQAILDSVQDKLDEIKAKLEAGADFDDLIAEYGTDPGMQDETTRKNGYEVHAGSILYDEDFQEGAMKLAAIGDISDPIVTSFGVHILKYVRDIPGGAVELTDEMKEELRASILNERANEKIGAWIEQALAEAEIVWTEAGEDWKLVEEAATTEEAAPAEEETAEAGTAE